MMKTEKEIIDMISWLEAEVIRLNNKKCFERAFQYQRQADILRWSIDA